MVQLNLYNNNVLAAVVVLGEAQFVVAACAASAVRFSSAVPFMRPHTGVNCWHVHLLSRVRVHFLLEFISFRSGIEHFLSMPASSHRDFMAGLVQILADFDRVLFGGVLGAVLLLCSSNELADKEELVTVSGLTACHGSAKCDSSDFRAVLLWKNEEEELQPMRISVML